MLSNAWQISKAGLQLALKQWYQDRLSTWTPLGLEAPFSLPSLVPPPTPGPVHRSSVWPSAASENISRNQPHLQVPKEKVGLANSNVVPCSGPVNCGVIW